MNLHTYHWVVVNSSGGKDSQVTLDETVRHARFQGYPLDRVVVAHADLGPRVEWPGTRELVQAHADHYGLQLVVERRPQGDILDQTLQRGRWPSSQQRWCTSDHKRGQIARLFTRLTQRSRGEGVKHVRLLNVFGFRSEESPARAKRQVFSRDGRLSNTQRTVETWLPVHHWTEDQVWTRIRDTGVRHHWAYDRGMSRLSCRFCIFAPRSQLMTAALQPENREAFEQYVQVEIKTGHKFRVKQSLQEIQAAIAAGERPAKDNGKWNM
jgi:3'-phosphoadenosine 5'-phosphosulfate sulfotransferase (PAPS reductase)/FAD synthetase